MDEFEKEIYNEKYPKIVSIGKARKILEQMEKSVCRLYKKDGSKGT